MLLLLFILITFVGTATTGSLRLLEYSIQPAFRSLVISSMMAKIESKAAHIVHELIIKIKF
jgi:hypothetical protein